MEKEKLELKPKLKEFEFKLIENTNPDLYKTYKRMILKDETERLEKLKYHSKGCSEKCRVKAQIYELEVKRNKDIADLFLDFEWC